jgi:hypothetical protein
MRPWIALLIIALTVVFLAGYGAYALHVTRAAGSWTGGSPHILAAMAIALVGTCALAGGLMWLAFFSSRRGYDEPPKWDDPPR